MRSFRDKGPYRHYMTYNGSHYPTIQIKRKAPGILFVFLSKLMEGTSICQSEGAILYAKNKEQPSFGSPYQFKPGSLELASQ